MDNVYRDRYFKTEYFKGLEEISKVISEAYPEKAPTLRKFSSNYEFSSVKNNYFCSWSRIFMDFTPFKIKWWFGWWYGFGCKLDQATEFEFGNVPSGTIEARSCRDIWKRLALNFTSLSLLFALNFFLRIIFNIDFFSKFNSFTWLVKIFICVSIYESSLTWIASIRPLSWKNIMTSRQKLISF